MVERENTNQEVEFRKIQYSGKSSFTIALPKKWVTNQKLNAGDRLSVRSDNSNNLILSTNKNSKEKKRSRIVVDQSDNKGQIERKIIATYISGYTEINICSKQERITPQQRSVIKKLVRNKLVGSEIIEDSNLIISIQVILNPEEFNIQNTLRRMSVITQGMHGDIIYAIKKNDIEMCNEIIKTDDDVDRFSLYSVRQLRFALENESSLLALGVSNKIYCLGYRMISKSLERSADHATMIGEQLIGLKKPFPEIIVSKLDEFSKFSIDNLDNAMKALFKKDYKLADQVVTSCLLASKMEQKILNSNIKLSQEQNTCLTSMLEHIKRVSDHSADIGEVVINLTIE